MKKNLVISSVAAIAAINPEGFTINAANLQPVTTGYAVALKRTQSSFGAEGLAKGREEGLAKGLVKGREEGRAEGILSTAKTLKSMGLSVADIQKATGLSEEEIMNI